MTMAQNFIKAHAAWKQLPHDDTRDLSEYLYANDLLGDGPEQMSFFQHWDVRPTPRFELTYHIMDFHDGSLAIKRAADDGWTATA